MPEPRRLARSPIASMEPNRFPLALLPTPCHPLARASKELGLDLWIKRDDLTGFVMGGNKARKLEYLIQQALDLRVEVVVSCGAAHSNFLRQLAAAAEMAGLEFRAAVMECPYDSGAGPPTSQGLAPGFGNQQICSIIGGKFVFFPDGDWETLFAHGYALEDQAIAEGKRALWIPVGGSSKLGVFALWKAAQELTERFDRIVFASSSGSTHVGLGSFFKSSGTEIYGVACDPEPEIAKDFAELSKETHEEFPLIHELKPEELKLDFGFVGEGYGIPSQAGNEAIRWLAQREGILLDPVYTGKAFAALLHHAPRWRGERLLFWHTGGIPSLFALDRHTWDLNS